LALKKILSLLSKNSLKSDKDFKNWVKLTTGYAPRNISIYQQAFFHSSVSVKRSGTTISNERLESLPRRRVSDPAKEQDRERAEP
jgi:hypothetical protein